MSKIKDRIVLILRQELEHQEEDSDYSQWVMGVSIRENQSIDNPVEKPMYLARVVVKTSESPYVDGMDISFMMVDGDIVIDPIYYENTPEYQGGTEEDALSWLGVEDIYYHQISNPFSKCVDSND